MGVRVSLSELAEQTGGNFADLTHVLAPPIRDFACSLYQQFPDQITGNSNLGASFTRGYMDKMCPDKTPPPTPAGGFTGGQCPTTYFITFDYVFNGVTTRYTFGVVYGKIKRFAMETQGNDHQIVVYAGTQQNPEASQRYVMRSTGSATNKFTSYKIVSIYRADNQPDTCGNTPHAYPPTNPTQNDYKTTINVTLKTGDQLSFPLTYSPVDFNFPMNFDLGGLNVTLDMGGLEFHWHAGDKSANEPPNPHELPDGQPNPIPPSSDIQDFPPPIVKLPPPNEFDYDVEEEPEENSDEKKFIEKLAYVTLDITNKPANAKLQFGNGGPNVYYCGWFEFKADGKNFNRTPVHFDNNVFRAPEGANGYAYTLYQGFSGIARRFTTKEQVKEL